ncbi:MAG TPA: hypothetical protein VF623_02915, partial [Segetibacter sp.]
KGEANKIASPFLYSAFFEIILLFLQHVTIQKIKGVLGLKAEELLTPVKAQIGAVVIRLDS